LFWIFFLEFWVFLLVLLLVLWWLLNCLPCAALWKRSSDRKKFFEAYAKAKGFDPYNPDNWYDESPRQLIHYKKVVLRWSLTHSLTLTLTLTHTLTFTFTFFLSFFLVFSSFSCDRERMEFCTTTITTSRRRFSTFFLILVWKRRNFP